MYVLKPRLLSHQRKVFNSVARNPVPTCPKHFKISTGINRDISKLPICSAAFEIKGSYFTIYTNLQIPVTKPLPSELHLVLKIIRSLARFRGLSYSTILYTTLCTYLNANIDVHTLAADLPLWDISA